MREKLPRVKGAFIRSERKKKEVKGRKRKKEVEEKGKKWKRKERHDHHEVIISWIKSVFPS